MSEYFQVRWWSNSLGVYENILSFAVQFFNFLAYHVNRLSFKVKLMQNKRYHSGVTNYYLSFQEDNIIYCAADNSLMLHILS